MPAPRSSARRWIPMLGRSGAQSLTWPRWLGRSNSSRNGWLHVRPGGRGRGRPTRAQRRRRVGGPGPRLPGPGRLQGAGPLPGRPPRAGPG
eukprot:5266636-Alexandrium_andersonii.AAC.1